MGDGGRGPGVTQVVPRLDRWEAGGLLRAEFTEDGVVAGWNIGPGHSGPKRHPN